MGSTIVQNRDRGLNMTLRFRRLMGIAAVGVLLLWYAAMPVLSYYAGLNGYFSVGDTVASFNVGGISVYFLVGGLEGQPSHATYFIAFYQLMQIIPTILFLMLFFGSGIFFVMGLKKGNWYFIILSILCIIVMITIFEPIVTNFYNLLAGNW
jgi:hypothetical protein